MKKIIKVFQDQMHARGYFPVGTGDYGPNTLAMVTRLQAQNGLVPNGEIGPNTWMLAWAWNLGVYNFANGGDYYSWVAGCLDTNGVTGTATDIGGGVVATSFSAVHIDGSVSSYSGTYTVGDGIIGSGRMLEI